MTKGSASKVMVSIIYTSPMLLAFYCICLCEVSVVSVCVIVILYMVLGIYGSKPTKHEGEVWFTCV